MIHLEVVIFNHAVLFRSLGYVANATHLPDLLFDASKELHFYAPNSRKSVPS